MHLNPILMRPALSLFLIGFVKAIVDVVPFPDYQEHLFMWMTSLHITCVALLADLIMRSRGDY